MVGTVGRVVDDKKTCMLGDFRRNDIPYPTKNFETIDSVVVDVFLGDVDTARVGRRSGAVSEFRQRKVL